MAVVGAGAGAVLVVFDAGAGTAAVVLGLGAGALVASVAFVGAGARARLFELVLGPGADRGGVPVSPVKKKNSLEENHDN